MLFAFRLDQNRLRQLDPQDDLAGAAWVDVYRPMPAQVARVEALGVPVPTLADMEEIEVSNRLYRVGRIEVLTVSLPGLDVEKRRTFGPVAFLITPERLVTVRYHAPRPFETFARHAEANSAGCSDIAHLFLGLIEEIVARLADLLEGVGRALDDKVQRLFDAEAEAGKALAPMLRTAGRLGEDLANLRLSLLSLERALTTFGLGRDGDDLRPHIKARMRDIQALAVHADFLSARIAHVTDVILGMVTLEQTRTGRIVSVVAVLFLPPTLVASVYGMNFAVLPGLEHPHGYLIATGLMLGSALGTYLCFRWKGWL